MESVTFLKIIKTHLAVNSQLNTPIKLLLGGTGYIYCCQPIHKNRYLHVEPLHPQIVSTDRSGGRCNRHKPETKQKG